MIKSCQSKILLFMALLLVARTTFALEIPGPQVDNDWLAEHLDVSKYCMCVKRVYPGCQSFS